MSESNFNKANARLGKHILGIKQLIDQPDLRGLSEETGKLGQRFMDMHNVQGNYLGGEYQNRGYSTATLPLFFFGDATLVERSGNMRLSAPEFNLSNLLIKKQDINWTTTREGKKMAYLKGGYSTFLRYARPGKNLSKVDHTFTGAMLRNLTYDMIFQQNGATITWYVRPPHDRKAAFTHAKREWLGLFSSEIEEIAQMASEKFGIIVYDNLKTE